MPTYQYACTACGEPLEAVQTFTDAPLTDCPECGGALRKVFSAVGVVFKGSGFYKTDSRSTKSATDKPTDKPAEKSAETSSEKPAEKKTETAAPVATTQSAPAAKSGAPAA